MKRWKFFSLFFLMALVACSFDDQATSKNPDEWEIDSNGIGVIRLGGSASETKSLIDQPYEIYDLEKFGFDVLEGGEILITVSTVADEIGVIEIYSDKFETQSGLKVGMTMAEIEDLGIDFTPQMDKMNGRVFFEPKEFQTSTQGWILYFTTNDNSPVCGFEKIPNGDHFIYEPRGNMNKKAVVEFIRIHNL